MELMVSKRRGVDRTTCRNINRKNATYLREGLILVQVNFFRVFRAKFGDW